MSEAVPLVFSVQQIQFSGPSGFDLSEQPSRHNFWTFEKETEVRLI